MSPPRGAVLGVAAAALGTAAAGGAALAQRRRVRGRRVVGRRGTELGSLRSTPRAVHTSDGLRLHAEVDEPDPTLAGHGGPTLVFVHGYALNLDCWHFQREHFRGRTRTVFYDQRSHGRSERSAKASATIDQLGHDLKCVLDQFVPEGPVVLVGHSMGGMTLMALAEHYPELFGDRVRGIALVATTAGGLRPHGMLSPLLPDRLMSQVTPRALTALAKIPAFVDGARRAGSDIGFVVTSKLAFGDRVPDTYVEFVDQMLSQTPFDVLAEFFPNFDTFDKFEVLKAFDQVPTVIVCGDADLLTSIDHSRKMASLLTGAALVECPGAGHMVILERPDDVNAAIERLLGEILPGREGDR